jgi:hypothetical protein
VLLDTPGPTGTESADNPKENAVEEVPADTELQSSPPRTHPLPLRGGWLIIPAFALLLLAIACAKPAYAQTNHNGLNPIRFAFAIDTNNG